MRTTEQIQWCVPIRYQIGVARRELPTVFPPRVLARLGFATLAIVCAASYGLPKMLPELQVDWTILALKGLGCLIAIVAMCCVITIVPPFVTVSAKGIIITEGQHSRRFSYSDLAEVRIETGSAPWTMLVLRPRQRLKAYVFPVGNGVSLEQLSRIIRRHWAVDTNAQQGGGAYPPPAARLLQGKSRATGSGSAHP